MPRWSQKYKIWSKKNQELEKERIELNLTISAKSLEISQGQGSTKI